MSFAGAVGQSVMLRLHLELVQLEDKSGAFFSISVGSYLEPFLAFF